MHNDIASYEACPNLDPLMRDLDEHGLVKHALELDAYGLTVIPPETMGTDNDFPDRLREAILRTCERRNEIEIGDHTTASPEQAKVAFKNSWYLLQEDDVFAEAATNPRVLTIARWLLGQSAMLTGHTWIIKPESAGGLGLHSDAHGIPPGGGHIAHVANLSWLCTDYAGADDGPTVFVPGSHRYGRATLPHESSLTDTPFKVVPLAWKSWVACRVARFDMAWIHAEKESRIASHAGPSVHAHAHETDPSMESRRNRPRAAKAFSGAGACFGS